MVWKKAAKGDQSCRFWVEVKQGRSGLQVSAVESLQVRVVLPEPRMDEPGHAQQAFAAELLPLVF